ncbi:MAG TPA: alpha/beta fold hydrolase, partial [Kofleriaceae bacterium]|nr:alpha/beta fold hydrolase [Kofleriaceae bacterium]
PRGDVLGLDALAGELAAWLATRAPAVVIGHSMGGVLATLVAERAPAAVRAIVNIEGNVSPGDCVFSGRAVAYSESDFAARGFAELRAWVGEQAATRPPMRGYEAAMAHASPHAFHRHARDLVALSAPEDLAARFANLRVPALYVAGVPDGICARSRELLDRHCAPPSGAARPGEAASGARWIALEPAGHWVYADQLATFVAQVTAFVAGG